MTSAMLQEEFDIVAFTPLQEESAAVCLMPAVRGRPDPLGAMFGLYLEQFENCCFTDADVRGIAHPDSKGLHGNNTSTLSALLLLRPTCS